MTEAHPLLTQLLEDMSHLDITPTSTTSEPTPLQPVEYFPLSPSHAQIQDDALDTIDWPTFDSCNTWGDWMEASEPLQVQAISADVAEKLEDFFLIIGLLIRRPTPLKYRTGLLLM